MEASKFLIPIFIIILSIGCMENTNIPNYKFYFEFENNSDNDINISINTTVDGNRYTWVLFVKHNTIETIKISETYFPTIIKIDLNAIGYNQTIFTIEEPLTGIYTIYIEDHQFSQPFGWKEDVIRNQVI